MTPSSLGGRSMYTPHLPAPETPETDGAHRARHEGPETPTPIGLSHLSLAPFRTPKEVKKP